MIKVCLDSNIFISALLFDGKPEEILFMASVGDIKIITSPAILQEVDKVLRDKFNYPESEVKRILKNISSISTLVVPKKPIKILKHIPDNKILEAGLEGQVDYIITGDKKHLLSLKQFQGIPIVVPDQFLKEIAGK